MDIIEVKAKAETARLRMELEFKDKEEADQLGLAKIEAETARHAPRRETRPDNHDARYDASQTYT